MGFSSRTEKHINLGKEKIKSIIDEYCRDNGIKTISETTIGRYIKDKIELTKYYKKISHFGNIKNISKDKKERIKISEVKKKSAPGELVQIDSVTEYINGVKRYTINAIDVYNRQTFAYGYNKLNSKNAQNLFKKLEYVFGYKIKEVQTDNGLEFHGEFMEYLKKNNIKQYFNYPRCPKMNCFIERFSRTLREGFIDWNTYDFKENLNLFNRNMMEYLIWYNTKRPHKSLGKMSPIDYTISQGHFSDMYGTSTNI